MLMNAYYMNKRAESEYVCEYGENPVVVCTSVSFSIYLCAHDDIQCHTVTHVIIISRPTHTLMPQYFLLFLI